MKKSSILKAGMMSLMLMGTLVTASAYNGKYTLNLTSGWMSPWAYTDYVYKVTNNEAPVIKCTNTSGSTNNFEYDMANSNGESRVVSFTQAGTFGFHVWSNFNAVGGYQYAARATRHGGAWNSSATTYGNWSPDSY